MIPVSGKLSGIDLVEINTSIGGEKKAEKTVNNSIEILTSCFAKEPRAKEDVPSYPAKLEKH